MQTFGLEIVAIVGRRARTTAVAITDFCGGIGERQVPRWTGRSLRKPPPAPMGRLLRAAAGKLSLDRSRRQGQMSGVTDPYGSGQMRSVVNVSFGFLHRPFVDWRLYEGAFASGDLTSTVTCDRVRNLVSFSK